MQHQLRRSQLIFSSINDGSEFLKILRDSVHAVLTAVGVYTQENIAGIVHRSSVVLQHTDICSTAIYSARVSVSWTRPVPKITCMRNNNSVPAMWKEKTQVGRCKFISYSGENTHVKMNYNQRVHLNQVVEQLPQRSSASRVLRHRNCVTLCHKQKILAQQNDRYILVGTDP